MDRRNSSGILRSVPFEIRDAQDRDGLTLEGYAAVFDAPTRIESYEGVFDETIRQGAFRNTLAETMPVLQFDHGAHPVVGSIPIGNIVAIREDIKGLYVRARLSDNWLVKPVRDAIANGSVNGMSFRFQVAGEEWRDASGKAVRQDEVTRLLWSSDERGPLQRTLTEVKLSELGPVVFPAYKQTTVSVRSADRPECLSPHMRTEYLALIMRRLAG